MANELLASLDDINTHLPGDKAKMEDADDDLLQIDVNRYVKSLLSGTFTPVVMSGWSSPGNTPELIRSIAGRLIAAKWYATLYAEDTDAVSALAMRLYNEAVAMINDIRSGRQTVLDATLIPIATTSVGLEDGDFFPNDGAPKFTMTKIFA